MVSKVRAKFQVESITMLSNGLTTVELLAVTTGCEENKSFSSYTPYGKTVLSITPGTSAADFFQPGEDIYLDFTKAK